MERMSTLPACTRLSLWVTAAWAGRLSVDDAIERALPDIDDVSGDVDRLALWGQLGERLLLCALPRSGDLTTVPRGNPELSAEAAEVGECVYVPGLGGALVPHISPYGPAGDEGWQARWTAYDAAPSPTHRVEALDEAQIERELREALRSSTAALEGLDVQPFAGSGMREAMDDRLADARWGVPSGLPGRAARTLQLAATVATVCHAAAQDSPALTVGDHGARQAQLLRLGAVADRALQDATNVAVLSLSGLRPARR